MAGSFWETACQPYPGRFRQHSLPWMPCLGGLTIEETLDRQDSARKASDKCRKETRDGSKGDGAWSEVWVGFVWVCTCTHKVRTFHPKYVPSTYYFPRVRTWYIMVCTVFKKILQLMLFHVVSLWETILCVLDMYAVVLWYWISATIGVRHSTWHYFGTYSAWVRSGMYRSVLFFISCTDLYLVRTGTYHFRTGTY